MVGQRPAYVDEELSATTFKQNIAREKAAIVSVAEDLEQAIERVHIMIGELNEKITPIMSPVVNGELSTDPEPFQGSSPLYTHLRELLDRTNAATFRVRQIKSNIEV